MKMDDMVLLHRLENPLGDGNPSGFIGAYGPELLLDCRFCDPVTFTRKSIRGYMKVLCKEIKMKREALYFWDDEGALPEERQTEVHTVGISAVQFILTSSIVIHTLSLLERAYIDIFSCKKFDDGAATQITQEWFKAKIVGAHLIQRF